MVPGSACIPIALTWPTWEIAKLRVHVAKQQTSHREVTEIQGGAHPTAVLIPRAAVESVRNTKIVGTNAAELPMGTIINCPDEGRWADEAPEEVLLLNELRDHGIGIWSAMTQLKCAILTNC